MPDGLQQKMKQLFEFTYNQGAVPTESDHTFICAAQVTAMDIRKPEETRLCSSCASFYGTEASQWLCSGCFKAKHSNAQTKTSAVSSQSKPLEIKPQNQKQGQIQRPQQKDTTRCFKCNKKVGLLGVNCKCEYIFCNSHRLPEAHQCNVDYRKLGQATLTKNNQMVAPSKITEI